MTQIPSTDGVDELPACSAATSCDEDQCPDRYWERQGLLRGVPGAGSDELGWLAEDAERRPARVTRKYYAKLDDTWSCESCPTDSTKIGSVVPHTSGKSDTCASSCASGKYWDGSACQACPANSDGDGGAETSCTCDDNYRAVVSDGTWTCEECSGRQGSQIPQSNGESDECVASKACTTRQYFDGKAKACQTCPDGSTSEGGTAEFCTCGENMYAVKNRGTWKCVEMHWRQNQGCQLASSGIRERGEGVGRLLRRELVRGGPFSIWREV